jgi:hypothetical protein
MDSILSVFKKLNWSRPLFFNGNIKIKFKTQFSNQKIEELFKEITTNNPLAK